MQSGRRPRDDDQGHQTPAAGDRFCLRSRAPRMVKRKTICLRKARSKRCPRTLISMTSTISRKKHGKRRRRCFPWRPICSNAASSAASPNTMSRRSSRSCATYSRRRSTHDCDAIRRLAGALFRPFQHRPIARNRSRSATSRFIRMTRQRRHGTPSRTWGSISFTPIARGATTSRGMGSMRIRSSTHRASRARSITFPTCCAARAICSQPKKD